MLPRIFYVIIWIALLVPNVAWADYAKEPAPQGTHALSDADRMNLARQFLERIKQGFRDADNQLKEKRDEVDLSSIPDGEQLFFRIRLAKKIAIDHQLLATVEQGHLMISFRDFIDAVEFPIAYDAETGTAQGWYIRENKPFSLNAKTRQVITDRGTFELSDTIKVEGEDLYIPSDELASWFGFALKPNVPQLELNLVSDMKLPIQEKIERHNRTFASTTMPEPSLPRLDDPQKMAEVPFVDVSTNSRYYRPGDNGKSRTTNSANIRTAGDFAQGTLTTQSQLNQEDRLTNFRINYKKESLEPELLGPLKARRYELGDITPVQVPINERFTYGTGVRVTNKDPLRATTSAYTDITGSAIPGWDVELYRDAQLLGVQTVGEDGRYTFPKVNLYSSDNTFRVVFYGLQGEIREEEIYIPVDPKRLADSGSAYDISLMRQDTTTYNKNEADDKDIGAPALTALYEVPVGKASALTAGLVTRQANGDQKALGIVGLSTDFAETLWNFNTGIDNAGEMAAEIIARKDLGEHQLRNETRFATKEFGYEEPDDEDIDNLFSPSGPIFEREVFGNEFNVNGPLDLNLGLKPRYNMTLNYGHSSEGQNALTGVAGFSTRFKPISFNQQLMYEKNDTLEDDRISTQTNLVGTIGRNRLRLTSDYEIKPENELKRVVATVNRFITPKMEAQAGIQRMMDRKLTEVSAKLNWDTGYGNLSPGLAYNSDNDLIATLNTRFGLARDPLSGSPKLFDKPITTNGGVSAFVYWDKDGNNQFNEGDEPIQDAIVKAPQNGGREITDENGHAFFSRMGQLRLTDVFVDPNSLADPYWIPAYEGASVLPREGHVVSMEFPVHMSGEMDGTVYAKTADGSSMPLKSVGLGLYDQAGKKIQSTVSEQDGFYLFSKIPPGSYYLIVDDPDIQKNALRPLPQQVKIGYEGTTIYANNIYLQNGMKDVPMAILANQSVYGDRAKEFEGRTFVLNLGSYKSQVMMGLVWFKIRTLHKGIFQSADVIQKPSEALPDGTSSSYVLRVSIPDNNLESAYKKCGVIARGGNACSVEILPGGLEQEFAESQSPAS